MTLRLVRGWTAAASGAAMLVICLASLPAAAEAPKTLSLADALARARRENPALRSQADGVRAAGHTRDAQKAMYLPIVKVEGNGILWDSPLEVSLGGSGGGAPPLPPPSTPYEQAFAGFLQGMSTPVTFRDQLTAEAGVSIIQPLTALITVSEGYELFDLTVATRKLKQREVRRSVELGTATAWFRLLQARAMRDVARQTVVQMQAQLDRVNALVARGVAGENDRLKLEVAVAGARQRALAAETAVSLAQSGLLTLMGAPAGQAVVPEAPPGEAVPAVSVELTHACETAVANRVEVQMATSGVRLAELGVVLEKAKLIPGVNVIANYKHSEGSSFAESDAAFVGIFLDWQAFHWNATTSSIDAASARAEEIRGQVEALKARVCLAVRQTALRHRTAVKALDVAKAAERQATEAVRLETRRLEAGAATSTDVVVAEAALSAAQGNRLAAYYEAFVANADFRAAMGEPLTAQTLLAGD